MTLDSETKAVELPEHHGDELRLWLRLLTCTTLIEGEVRSRLRERFDVTLPRFDLMAQLDKVSEGMTLSDVSKRMMVSNGNVTGLVERLVESGHLDRRTSEADRRVQMIRLTKAGRAEFRKMAAEHELWIADMFGDLSPKDVRELMRLLAKTKASAQLPVAWACTHQAAGRLMSGRPPTVAERADIPRGGQRQTKLPPWFLAGRGPFNPGYFCANTSERNAFTSSCAFFIAASL
jgi:DNA-binding MarR family transcriptional regulator